MKTLFALVVLACVMLPVTGCGSSAQNQIVGKWEAANGAQITAEFRQDGKGCLTMFGMPVEGTYRLHGDNELEWTVNGMTQKFKMKVNAKELEFSSEGQTMVYKRA